MVIYKFAYSHGSGLSPGPTPLSNINKCKFKYNIPRLRNKEQTTDSWLAECLLSLCIEGEVPGSNPADPIPFTQISTNHNNQPDSDTWRQWVGPRVQTLFAANDTCQHVTGPRTSNQNAPNHQYATSARWYGPPRGRTDCTDRYSQHPKFFSLFDLAVKSRYLLHTDSICENKYTAGIRKTRRTQWHYFRLNPSTLKIEQILIP
jgi:hypothetical protein